MVLLANTAEGGSNGTTVTTVNSGGGSGDAFSGVQIDGTGTLTYSTAHPYKGTLGYAIAPQSGNVCYLRYDDPANPTQIVFRLYVYLSAYPSTSGQNLLRFTSSGGTQRAAISVTTTGVLRFYGSSSSTILSFSSGVMSLATQYRMEGSIDSTTGNALVRVYAGESTTVITTLSLDVTAGAIGTGGFTQTRIGKASSADAWGTIYLDDIAIQTGTLTLLGVSTNALATPANLTMVNSPSGTRSLVIDWDSVSGAVNYELEVRVSTGSGTWAALSPTGSFTVADPTTTITLDDSDGVAWSNLYDVRVRAVAV